MRCSACNKWIPDKASFCQNCGARRIEYAEMKHDERQGQPRLPVRKIIGLLLIFFGLMGAFGYQSCSLTFK